MTAKEKNNILCPTQSQAKLFYGKSKIFLSASFWHFVIFFLQILAVASVTIRV